MNPALPIGVAYLPAADDRWIVGGIVANLAVPFAGRRRNAASAVVTLFTPAPAPAASDVGRRLSSASLVDLAPVGDN